MAKIKPLAGYCLILPIEKEDQTTSGGLLLPEKAKEKPMKGTIIRAGKLTLDDKVKLVQGGFTGEGRMHYIREMAEILREGNIVIFHRWSGQDVRDGDKEYKLVKFSDILAVYE